jgi:ankyrin repeat protein
VFSAIATGDLEAIQRLVEDNPDALARRMSRFEGGLSALHYVVAPPDGLIGGGFRTGAHYAALDLLLELGADVEARDDKGRTPMAIAMLQGDRDAMRRLQAAGAQVPAAHGGGAQLSALAGNVRRIDPAIRVADMRATIAWYCAIGFTLTGQHALDTPAAWAGLSLGDCFLMLVPGGTPAGAREISFWLRTDRVDELYRALKQRQLDRASAVLAGAEPAEPEARVVHDLHDAFYGEREFTIVDLNGYHLTFAQAISLSR